MRSHRIVGTIIGAICIHAAAPAIGALSDADGNVYRTVTIGSQIWMAENLRTTRYSNGDVIPTVADNNAWGKSPSGALSWYNNDASFKDTYGALYNWPAVVDKRGLCPKDWRVPSDSDLFALVAHLGGFTVAGGKMKETGISHWTRNIDATNSSGFTAIPSGDRHDVDGQFYDLDYLTYLWTVSESAPGKAWVYEIGKGSASVRRPSLPIRDGLSVRCLQDYKMPEAPTVRDVQGNEYKSVRIGSQTWMAENLRATKYRDRSPISNVVSNEKWLALTTGGFCWYDNDAAKNSKVYGALYNWFAVADVRGMCPVGWHVPSEGDWSKLQDYLGGRSVAGNRLKDISLGRWVVGSYGTSGFAALPGGFRYVHRPIHQASGAFDALGNTGMWWSSTEDSVKNARFEYIDGSATGIYGAEDSKRSGFSVRCIKD